MTERFNKGESARTWMIGEDCTTPGIAGDALRYLDNPHKATNRGFTVDDDPDHYSERYTGPLDNGGLHINSGIFNKAFYLMCEGGTHHLGGSMKGIGCQRSQRIWFYALTRFFTPNTGYRSCRQGVQNAARTIYGLNSVEYQAAVKAFDLVGIPH